MTLTQMTHWSPKLPEYTRLIKSNTKNLQKSGQGNTLCDIFLGEFTDTMLIMSSIVDTSQGASLVIAHFQP